MKKYILFGIVLVVVLGAVSFGIYKNKNIILLNPKRGDVQEAIYGLGTVKSDKIFEVKTGIMTTISKQFAKEGDELQKGDKMIAFEGSALFRAPFAGTVTSVLFQEGEIALPQVAVMRLEDLDDKYIEVSLEQEAALRVRKGQVAKIIFENLTGKKLVGKVKSIYPKQGDFLTHIEVNNLKENILPGMTADVVIEVGSKKDVLLIPLSAISEGRVIRQRGNKRKTVDVKIGRNDGTWGELLEGDITTDDQLVVKVK